MFSHPDYDGHEALLFTKDVAIGLRALIAIHDTTLGPAFGGCRMYPYASEQHAMTDVLRPAFRWHRCATSTRSCGTTTGTSAACSNGSSTTRSAVSWCRRRPCASTAPTRSTPCPARSSASTTARFTASGSDCRVPRSPCSNKTVSSEPSWQSSTASWSLAAFQPRSRHRPRLGLASVLHEPVAVGVASPPRVTDATGNGVSIERVVMLELG